LDERKNIYMMFFDVAGVCTQGLVFARQKLSTLFAVGTFQVGFLFLPGWPQTMFPDLHSPM
jgi:hypothetical protein